MPIAIVVKEIGGGRIAGTVEGGLYCQRQRRQHPAKRYSNIARWNAWMRRPFKPGRYVIDFATAEQLFFIDPCDRPGGLR